MPPSLVLVGVIQRGPFLHCDKAKKEGGLVEHAVLTGHESLLTADVKQSRGGAVP